MKARPGRLVPLPLLLLLLCQADATPCAIKGGRSELILDVTESSGVAFDQPIEPRELPIEGEPDLDIDLELDEEGKKTFRLASKSLRLKTSLDRDQRELSTLRFEISCHVRSSASVTSIPVVVRIRDLNDNRPEFRGAPYHLAVKEDAVVNMPLFNGIQAEDLDSGRNGQVEYEVLEVSPDHEGSQQMFSIRFPHQGAVFLNAPLDYETTPLYRITIMAKDYSENEIDRLNSTTTLTIRVQDVDDQDPVFDKAEIRQNCSAHVTSSPSCIPEYYATVVEGDIAGVLDVYPGRIHAKDVDTLGATITYSFQSGTPTSYEDYFTINSRTAVVTQIKEVDRTFMKSFDIVIRAVENTPRRGTATARLLINVQKVDTSPPKLVILAYTGKVLEASDPGTPVLRDDGSESPFLLSVFDPDHEVDEPPPHYVFELTTSSFQVNEKGVLVVAVPNLDRDPPNLSEHTFQAIAREDREGGSASAPVTLTVRLMDINDNPPRLPIFPTITVPAGNEHRSVIEVKATDADEGQNAVVSYELLNDGRDKFSIDPRTGLIMAVGNLDAGENYFLNVKATDMGNMSSETFVEIVISRGPNTDGPIFSRALYSTIVSEDIAYGEEILSVQAKDPEDDVSYYSITGGNGEKSFEIDTLTGLITVVAPLDREEHPEYTLVVEAEDSEGKTNSANVVIHVTDVNDQTPSFVGEPYSFRVDEGLNNASVGFIKAEDHDLGVFGEVSYLLEGEASPFRISPKGGELLSDSALDYEKDQVHYVLAVARDHGDDPRSATTTVTILVNDLSDEAPVFAQDVLRVHVSEGAAVGAVVTTVLATDADTLPRVTYKMVDGDSRLFRVAPDTGRVTVAANLDHEDRANHSLVVGTQENTGTGPGATTLVIIEVEDVNDQTPNIQPIHTVTFAKEAPLNTLLTNVSAVDRDGTSPNNKIRFAFMDDNVDVRSYFSIDPHKGEIRLKRLLTNANFTELTVKISARDEGEPSLSTSADFRVLLVTGVVGDSFGEAVSVPLGGSSSGEEGRWASLSSSPRFSKDHYELQINENIPIGSLIVKVPLMNTTASSISCSILMGNENETFSTIVTKEGNCKIISSKTLDFEMQSSYNLSLVLHPEGYAINDDEENPVLSEAYIEITVKDMNDNSPTFILKDFDILKNYPKKTVLSYVLQGSPFDTSIIELKAVDSDSGSLGLIEYKLLPESNRGNYFSVEPETGRIYTKRKLYNVPLELQPFNLSLVARDKPGINGTQHSTIINVIIPVIEETHQSVLLLDLSKEEVNKRVELLRLHLSETTGKKAQIEEVKHVGMNPGKHSQVWFHLLEPNSWKPIKHQNLYPKKQKDELLGAVSESLGGISALQLVTPSQLKEKQKKNKKDSTKLLESEKEQGITRVTTTFGLSSLEYALVALAGVIIFFVLLAMIIIFVLWSRFSKQWNSADKTVMLIPPVIERPASASLLESVSKEYEVQVLHMSVPLDDDSVQEIAGESDSPRQPYLDNVSYISKSRNGLEGSSSGDSSGIATPSALVMDPSDATFGTWSPEDPMRGGDHFSSSHLDADPNGFSVSATNENVMFGRKALADPSPVETTTEL